MELPNITLETYLQTVPATEYHNGVLVDYYSKYKSIKDYLISNVYKDVTAGANFQELEMYFNDHGIDHINTVIERATQLVKAIDCKLSPKEVYFLLCSILIHDVGNIYGRYKHEQNLGKVIQDIQNLFSGDSTEQRIIYQIAKAHGGKTDRGSKDTIQDIKDKYFNNEMVKTQLISAILRFGDELADDRNRASLQMLKDKLLFHRPSEVFHAYSASISNVIIDHNTHSVNIDFSIPINFLDRTFGKLEEKVFLIDEIYQRLLKVHLELKYCQKYMNRYIPLDKILVSVEFIPTGNNPFDNITKLPDAFTFTISETGFPSKPANRLFDLCPELILDPSNHKTKDGIYYLNTFQEINKAEKR